MKYTMSDGRVYTSYVPNCELNNSIKNQFGIDTDKDYKTMLQSSIELIKEDSQKELSKFESVEGFTSDTNGKFDSKLREIDSNPNPNPNSKSNSGNKVKVNYNVSMQEPSLFAKDSMGRKMNGRFKDCPVCKKKLEMSVK